jgi:hypothetical protein
MGQCQLVVSVNGERQGFNFNKRSVNIKKSEQHQFEPHEKK